MMTTNKIAVFASGSGSNFQAIHDAIRNGKLAAELVLVVTDKPDAYVLRRAAAAGVEALALRPQDFISKADYERAILIELHSQGAEWLVLAGYMRLIGPVLLEAYPNRIVNIHPSLLPEFPGKDAIGQTLAAGREEAGVTVHFVDAGMDTGPIIAQRTFRLDNRDRQTVEEAVHRIEHELYPATLQKLFSRQ
ncbi:phosphoribosylglycinamide formyltransferase [Planococcus lenghuensis]|uniref:Phosphoribosylglycinamide formyltransferase n=1 Tax=Planococcus lenghuensis TaxID=2213202 RepID=A0A1Q2KW73_9BACL|nr:phosphoribosylglycinamide formyltransferase [Planococcus lenghuensis]AQQ52439.1 phosphoribosylglycinamide formyltransferase [Planococcus lenghuensis]